MVPIPSGRNYLAETGFMKPGLESGVQQKKYVERPQKLETTIIWEVIVHR